MYMLVTDGDITQGLPRVEELFEARKPKNCAIIAEVGGVVSIGKAEKNDLLQVTIRPYDEKNQQVREYVIPYGIMPKVKAGQKVEAGDNITEGAKNPHDILRICGLKETYRYLVKEVQKVYKSQGVEINDKHIEVMVRQMLHKVQIATPVFDGAREVDINDTIRQAGMEPDGKTLLYDGRTGLPFHNRVTVGCVYMLKLHHLVDDKIHARSTGPYSLVTQQPLGGKAQFGGQRFGKKNFFVRCCFL